MTSRTILCLPLFWVITCGSLNSQCQWHVQRGVDSREQYMPIQFVDSLHGWAGRNPNVRDGLLRTINGGKTWDTINFAFGIGAVGALSFIDTLKGWCTIPSLANLYKTTDGGLTWGLLYNAPDAHLFFSGIQFVDSLHGYAVGQDTVFNNTRTWETTDGGVSWHSQIIRNASVNTRMNYADKIYGWLVGLQIYATKNGGLTWAKQLYDSVNVGGLYGISFVDSLRGWACATGSGWVIHTTDGGSSWIDQFQIQPQNQFTTRNISFCDSLAGWIFGFTFYQGDIMELIYRTTDGGSSWNQESIGLSRYLGNGIAIDECHAWAISDGDGSILGLNSGTDDVGVELTLPEKVDLSQNYPNPYNPSTTIMYQIPRREHVVLRIYNEVGQEIQTLVDEIKEVGSYTSQFDARNFASGVYYFQLITPSSHQTKKSVLIK